ncbi:MAG TPA: OsmC family protein [Elusimicrobiales bacterium]|nr:OsmC family protein [Elusimicrobiales bacterium]
MEIYFPGGKKVYAKHRDLTIATDQPKPAGGDGSAPSPFDLFLASMATCAGYYVLDFLSQRGIPSEQVRLEAKFTRNESTHLVSKVELDIKLPPDFPDKYRQAVVKAAELCAVARHLKNPPEISIKAV